MKIVILANILTPAYLYEKYSLLRDDIPDYPYLPAHGYSLMSRIGRPAALICARKELFIMDRSKFAAANGNAGEFKFSEEENYAIRNDRCGAHGSNMVIRLMRPGHTCEGGYISRKAGVTSTCCRLPSKLR